MPLSGLDAHTRCGLDAPTRCHLVEPVPFSAAPSEPPAVLHLMHHTPLIVHPLSAPYIAWPVLANTIVNCGGQMRCTVKVRMVILEIGGGGKVTNQFSILLGMQIWNVHSMRQHSLLHRTHCIMVSHASCVHTHKH